MKKIPTVKSDPVAKPVKETIVYKRVMPQPWFQARATALCIAELLHAEPHRVANTAIGERQLGPFVLPNFQRQAVWTLDQQIKLLESIWDGLPIGSYVFNQTSLCGPCDGWLLDGQQRITAILSYINDGFPVYGYLYSELSLPEVRSFRMMPIGVLITNINDRSQCEDVYNRLAYGGTPHDPI